MKLKNLTVSRAWGIFFGIWCILLTGLLEFWFPSPGLKQWFRVNSTLTERRHEIDVTEKKTNLFLSTARQLESNTVAQEREIRKVLGYLGDQELVFEFVH